MQAKQDWDAWHSLYCLQSARHHLFQETSCREVKSSPCVCVSIIFNQNWNVLSDPWHLGESWGILAYCFAITLLIDSCHAFLSILVCASLPRCWWVCCLWPFLWISHHNLLEFSCNYHVKIEVCSPPLTPVPLAVRVRYLFYLPSFQSDSPSLVDTSDNDQHSWLPQTLQWQSHCFFNFTSRSLSLYLLFPLCPHHKLQSCRALDLQTSTRWNYWQDMGL